MADGDVGAGVRILDELEDRGRDLRAFLEQLVEQVRGGLVDAGSAASAAAAGVGDSPAPMSVAASVAIARRLGEIDPNRAGIGGLRLQLELALFPLPDAAPSSVPPPRPAQAVGPGASGAGPTASPPKVSHVDPAPVAAASVPMPAPAHSNVLPAAERPAGAAPAAASKLAAPPEAPGAHTDVPTPAQVDDTARSGSDLDRLRHHWPEVVKRLSAHPPTKPLIAVCLPMSVEDGVVTLGFPEDQGFLRDVAERRRTVLEESIGSVLGKAVGVRCVATNLDNVPALPADAEAAFVLAEARRIFEADEPDAAEVS